MRFYIAEELSEKISKTPEGFLLCRDVIIARTGTQIYTTEEVPIESASGIVNIWRGAEEVFSEQSIASFVGKPVTNDHPPVMVSAENWKRYAVGTVQNVRRGTGIYDKFLYADLLITVKTAIDAVLNGKREISCGYDADYVQIGEGSGKQVNIIGNHVALVESGRCGEKCAITDKESVKMKEKEKFMARVLKAFMDAEPDMLEDPKLKEEKKVALAPVETEVSEGEKEKEKVGGTQDDDENNYVSMDEYKKFTARLDSIEQLLEKLKLKEKAEEEGQEEEEEAIDGYDGEEESVEKEKLVTDTAKKIIARGAILAPAIKFGSFDSKKTGEFKKKARAFKIKALDQAYSTAAGKEAIEPFLDGGKAVFDSLPCGKLDRVFIGASELMRAKNNAKMNPRSASADDGLPRNRVGNVDYNAIAREFYSKK